MPKGSLDEVLTNIVLDNTNLPNTYIHRHKQISDIEFMQDVMKAMRNHQMWRISMMIYLVANMWILTMMEMYQVCYV